MHHEWNKFALLILLIAAIWLVPYCHAANPPMQNALATVLMHHLAMKKVAETKMMPTANSQQGTGTQQNSDKGNAGTPLPDDPSSAGTPAEPQDQQPKQPAETIQPAAPTDQNNTQPSAVPPAVPSDNPTPEEQPLKNQKEQSEEPKKETESLPPEDSVPAQQPEAERHDQPEAESPSSPPAEEYPSPLQSEPETAPQPPPLPVPVDLPPPVTKEVRHSWAVMGNWADTTYSFHKEEFINPRIVEEMQAPLSDTGPQILLVDVHRANLSNQFFSEVHVRDGVQPYVYYKEENKEFGYRWIGATTTGIQVVHTTLLTGGTGDFHMLLFFVYGTADEIDFSYEVAIVPRHTIGIIGALPLGPNFDGTITLKDDIVTVLPQPTFGPPLPLYKGGVILRFR